MFKRIDHIEVVPSDLEASVDFYTRVLGFKLKERMKIDGYPPLRQVVYIQLGDTVLEFVDYDGPEPAPPAAPRVGYRALALEVDSMDETIADLAKKGVRPTMGPFDTGGGSLRAEIVDPDGLPIELRQW